MEWFTAAAISALAFGFNNILSKYLLEETSDLVFTFLYSLTALVLYTPLFLYFLQTTEFNPPFIYGVAMLLSGLGNTAAFLAFDEGIKESEVSEIVPLSRFQPVIVAVLGYIFLSENLTTMNALGIVAVTSGGYTALRHGEDSLFDPVRKLLKSSAHRYGLLSAFLWGSIAIIDRFATQQIAPEIYTFFLYLTMVTCLLIFLIKDNHRNLKDVEKTLSKSKIPYYIISGMTAIIGSLAIFTAFSKAPASKVIPVLQIQVMVSVIGGIILFDEDNNIYKILGSTILIAGVYLVVQ